MEILNTVIALLGLLATVIIGITQNTISKNKMARKMTAPIVFQTPAVMFLKI